MQINFHEKYLNSLFYILDFIAQDNYSASVKFKNGLEEKIKQLKNFPYKNRKSIYFDNDNIRDMIYKGYTIVYEVNYKDNCLEIMDIFNQNKR